MSIVGIDPGLRGGVCRWDDPITIHATPLIRISGEKDQYDVPAMAALVRPGDDVIIEQVGARPGQGVVSMFRFGFGAGLWHGICAAHGIIPRTVLPRVWKSALGLPADKSAARDLASTLAPDLAHYWKLIKNDGLAEAYLLARYALESISSPSGLDPRPAT